MAKDTTRGATGRSPFQFSKNGDPLTITTLQVKFIHKIGRGINFHTNPSKTDSVFCCCQSIRIQGSTYCTCDIAQTIRSPIFKRHTKEFHPNKQRLSSSSIRCLFVSALRLFFPKIAKDLNITVRHNISRNTMKPYYLSKEQMMGTNKHH
jgi:hypothetical protein